MPTSLLYVSRSLLTPPEQTQELADIVAVAQARNAALDVTGALVFTGRHFAQILEGDGPAVEQLMASIRRDSRHKDVDTVEIVTIDARRFAGWRMAYSGPSRYVDRHVVPLFGPAADAPARAVATDALIRLMQQFAEEGGVEGV